MSSKLWVDGRAEGVPESRLELRPQRNVPPDGKVGPGVHLPRRGTRGGVIKSKEGHCWPPCPLINFQRRERRPLFLNDGRWVFLKNIIIIKRKVYDCQVLRKAAELGFGAVYTSEEYGGTGQFYSLTE